VLTAAAQGQFAHEGQITSTGEYRGIFTWAVLDALRNGLCRAAFIYTDRKRGGMRAILGYPTQKLEAVSRSS
jgi:hypothetical protein